MKTQINNLVEMFDNENLTDYQKAQNNYLGGTLTDNLTKAVTSSNCTDTHEAYINSLNEQMTNSEECISEMEEFSTELKISYKELTGDEFRPYTANDKKLLGKQMATASRLEGLEKLKALYEQQVAIV